jgi:hypothetical protein
MINSEGSIPSRPSSRILQSMPPTMAPPLSVPSVCRSTTAALPTMPLRSFTSTQNWLIKPASTTLPVTRRPSAGPSNFSAELSTVWHNDLKDANTFYTKVLALEIMTFLDANSRGLHAIDMISLRTNMHQYYVQADGIPQYIVMLEDAQKRQSGRACPSSTSSLS